jgi:hypothetical protein
MKRYLWLAGTWVLVSGLALAGPPDKPGDKNQELKLVDCNVYARQAKDICGWDLDAVAKQCETFKRLAIESKCVTETVDAFACTTRNFSACPDRACCSNKACDPKDLAMEKCFKAFCDKNQIHPDCKALFPTK